MVIDQAELAYMQSCSQKRKDKTNQPKFQQFANAGILNWSWDPKNGHILQYTTVNH